MGLDSPLPPSTCVHLSLTPLPPPCERHKWIAPYGRRRGGNTSWSRSIEWRTATKMSSTTSAPKNIQNVDVSAISDVINEISCRLVLSGSNHKRFPQMTT